eukprot:2754643-Amphidinium_carterae.1
MKGSVQEPRLMQQDFESIIPDTGAITKLCGNEWPTPSRTVWDEGAMQAFYQESTRKTLLRSWWKLTRNPRSRSDIHHCGRHECPWRTDKDTNHIHSGFADRDGEWCIHVTHDTPGSSLHTPLLEETFHLPLEAFTGLRVTDKTFMDTGFTETVEDDWKNASLPQQRIGRLWIGGARLYVLEEYKHYAANAAGITEPTQEPIAAGRTEPTKEPMTEEPVPTKRSEIHEHTRFCQGSRRDHKAYFDRQLMACNAVETHSPSFRATLMRYQVARVDPGTEAQPQTDHRIARNARSYLRKERPKKRSRSNAT